VTDREERRETLHPSEKKERKKVPAHQKVEKSATVPKSFYNGRSSRCPLQSRGKRARRKVGMKKSD
jgi:hypothetical protein